MGGTGSSKGARERLSEIFAYAGPVGAAEIAAAALIAVVYSIAACWPIMGRLSYVCLAGDFDYSAEIHWAAFNAVTHFLQFPFWDPYKCGGIPLFANPQSRVLTPFFILHLMLGPIIALHIEIVVHLAIGWAGGYALARAAGIGRLGAAMCGTAFCSSSWYFAQLGAGHFTFMPYTFVPWIMALFWLAVERRRLSLAALGGLLMALTITEGGIYPVPHAALALGILAVALAVLQRSIWPLVVLAAMGVFSFGFAAIKLLPTAAMIGPLARWVDPFESNTPAMFMHEFFSRNQYNGGGCPGMFWGPMEYSGYIGPFVAVLLLVGIIMRRRESLPWLVTAVALLAFAAGNFGKYSPWVLLHRLPPFGAQHAPTRMLAIFTLVAGVLAGFGAGALCAMAKQWGVWLAALLVVATAADGWMVNQSNVLLQFQGARPVLMPFAHFREEFEEGDFSMYRTAVANIGVINCYEPSYAGPSTARGYNQPGYRGEQYLLGPGSVALARWTPNDLSYEIDAPAPTTLVVNQNYYPAWRLAGGKGQVANHGGLLAVSIPAGKQRLELAYRSRPFLLGLLISLVTLGAMIVLWRYERRRAARFAAVGDTRRKRENDAIAASGSQN